jgi:6-phospho-beta-glucosidase
MKMALIGAGSSYTPELFEMMAQRREECPITHVSLMDIDEKRLEAISGFCVRYVKKLGLPVTLESTTDLDRAVEGATFVNTQIRVAGNKGRVNDEKIPIGMGLVGQETTGPGGFFKALRTIPAMLEIADSIKRNAPKAWMINYTNPTGIVSQALHDYSDIKCAALCSGAVWPQWHLSDVLGVRPEDVQHDMFGLNHLSFAYNFKIKGCKPNEGELLKIFSAMGKPGKPMYDLAWAQQAIPSGYLSYYYCTRMWAKIFNEQTKTRGEEVLELEKEIFADFVNPDFDDKPPSLQKRGGGGYAHMALGIMGALYNGKNLWSVVNVPNQGIFRCLPDNAVIETAVLVNGNGITPLAAAPPPKGAWGLISMVKNYEILAAEAAVTGCRQTALLALASHPLVRDYEVAVELWDKMLEANKEYLPNFYK